MAFDPEHHDQSRRFFRSGIQVGRIEITPQDFWGWLTILPVLLLYTLVALIPIGFAITASFHHIPTLNPVWEWAGLSNYFEVFEMDQFWSSMWRGAVFMTGSTVVQLFFGVWMALVINKVVGMKSRFLSTLVFTSYLMPTIIVTLIFTFMFDPFEGVLTALGENTGLWEGNLLGNRALAMPALVLISSWKFAAFVTLFTLAQLQSIPGRFYEAAKVCGATTWEMFRDITLPRIIGAILVVVFLRAIFMFNKYDIIWQLTQGGPGSATQTMPVLAYRSTFQIGAFGLGNAVAMVMFMVLLLGGAIYLKILNPSQEVET